MKTRIELALDFAAEKHAGQTRRSNNNEAYFNHVKRVYEKVSEVLDNEDVLIAAILHDTIEDTETTYAEIALQFGPVVMNYLLWLTNTLELDDVPREMYVRANTHRLLNAPRAVQVIKMADMIDNLSDVAKTFKPAKAESYLKEKIPVVVGFSQEFAFDYPLMIELNRVIKSQFRELKIECPSLTHHGL